MNIWEFSGDMEIFVFKSRTLTAGLFSIPIGDIETPLAILGVNSSGKSKGFANLSGTDAALRSFEELKDSLKFPETL